MRILIPREYRPVQKKGTVLLSTSLAWPAEARQKLSLNLTPFLLLSPVDILLIQHHLHCIGQERSGGEGNKFGTPPTRCWAQARFWGMIKTSTVLVLSMAHRKWKEFKQQPSMFPGSDVPGCCLVSFHFLWAILCTSTVLPLNKDPHFVDNSLKGAFYIRLLQPTSSLHQVMNPEISWQYGRIKISSLYSVV